MESLQRRAHRAWLAGGVLATACVPTTSAYLTVPVTPNGEAGVERAVVEVSLAELALRMDDLRPEELAFFNLGREPVPHELRDRDGDGVVDTAILVIPVAVDGTRIMAVCPGPRSGEPLPEGGVEGAVTVQYAQAFN